MTGRGRRRGQQPRASGIAILAFTLAWGLLPAVASASERYDPRLRFRSIRTAHFTIHFHQGEEDQARRLAAIAEDVHATLSPVLLASPRRHTHVILVDQHDDANGWATPVPFNLIEISATAPSAFELIGHTDDWLRLVFAHEYTHILHLDRSRGFFGAMRSVFGRAPILFPNIFLAGWDVEGLATFHETAATGMGRLRSGAFRTIVDAAAAAGVFEPMDRATGALVDWPGGNAAYAYGAAFHEYLAGRFGPDAFGRLADVTSGRVPYIPGAAYTRTFGASAGDLWREFAASTRAKRLAEPSSRTADAVRPERITTHGFAVSGPRWLADGSLVYSVRTPHDFPALTLLPAGGAAPRRIATRYLGERASVAGDHVYFDQRELARSVSVQGDLYVLDLRDGTVRRLTHGARAADPDVSPDGAWLAAVATAQGRADLVRFPIVRRGNLVSLGDRATMIAEAETQFGAPRWSPSATRIAAERRRLGEAPHVVVVDPGSARVLLRIDADEGRVGEPEWIDDGQLVVTWDRPRSARVLCRVDLGTGDVIVAAAPPGGAGAAAVSRRDGRMAFVGYTPDGYDIFTLDAVVAPVATPPVRPPLRVSAERPDRAPASKAEPVAGSTPYRPSSMVPRFWMPALQTDEDQLELGAGTLGIDALGRHQYSATVRWSDRARPDWNAAYVYDRWRPSFFLSASDDVAVWQDADYRESSVDAGVTMPFRTVRRRQLLFGAFHLTREQDPRDTFDRRSVRAAYQVTTARRYGYSISLEEGVMAGATLDLTRRALGADADASTASFDLRAFPRVGGRHRILALRGAAAASWGDAAGRRVLGAGGSAAPGGTIVFGRDAIGLARGFAADDIVGYRAVVMNVDYRFPLLTLERGVGRLPIFVRQIHASVFADGAHAWVDEFRAADARASTGLELSADIVAGHYLPLTLTSGVAWRHDPSGAQQGGAVFARIGTAF